MTGTALLNSKSWYDRMEYWAQQAGASSAPPPPGLTVQDIADGIDTSNSIPTIQSLATSIDGQISTELAPHLSTTIPDRISDRTPIASTCVLRSDTSGQTFSTSDRQLRALVFANYSATTLYLEVHTAFPAPAAGVRPSFPPFPVGQNQVLFLDQALLGFDGFGWNLFTLRVSTSPSVYTPTATTAGLWALTARFKA